MPQFSDDLYLGTAVAGGSAGSNGPSNMTVGVGPLGRVFVYDVVPAASGTTTGQNQIALSQNLPNGALTLTAGTGTTAGTDAAGNAIIVLDCARTVAAYSAANLSAQTLTVTGYDVYGQKMSQTITAPNATTVQTTKAFKSILSVVSSGAIASALVVGLGTGIGLPVRVTDRGYIVSAAYNATALALSTVTIADGTNPATASTTDVRGFVEVGQTDNAKRLVITISVPALGSGPSATRLGAYGVTQNLA